MNIELGTTGILAKVAAINADGSRVWFDMKNGQTGWFDLRTLN